MMNLDPIDIEGQGDMTYSKLGLNPDDRLNFVRKVYGILSAQLSFTALFCIFAVVSDSFKNFLINNPWIFIFCLIGSLAVMYALICSMNMARQVPTNYILLGIFTFCQAFMVAALCAFSSPKLVLMAAILTAGITIALTVYAFTTKMDFTKSGEILFICGIALMLGAVFLMIGYSRTLHIFLCVLAVIFYGVYLLYDTQLIAGGKHQELSYDDYIIGALMIYVDVVSMFMEILRILNLLQGDSSE